MIKEKSSQEFLDAAVKHGIKEWRMHDCSLCGYKCGYLLCDDDGDECIYHPEKVLYDSGCDCTHRCVITPSSWLEVAYHYNLQTNEKYIKEMNEFWGFDNDK